MSQTEVAIASLIDGDGNLAPLTIVPAYDEDDVAFVPLSATTPPALTVGLHNNTLRALYHETGPLDYREVPVTWDHSEHGDYAVISIPEGTVRIPASCLRG